MLLLLLLLGDPTRPLLHPFVRCCGLLLLLLLPIFLLPFMLLLLLLLWHLC